MCINVLRQALELSHPLQNQFLNLITKSGFLNLVMETRSCEFITKLIFLDLVMKVS